MEDEDSIQRIEEMFELHISEMAIKEDITKFNSEKIIFQKYGLLNKNWLKKYKSFYNYDYFIKNEEIKYYDKENNIFIIKDLIPKFDKKSLKNKYDNSNIDISIPTNFILVSENFINLISHNFENKNNDDNEINYSEMIKDLIYEVIIGGKCIIIKDKHNENSFFITLYNKSKNNDNNSNSDSDVDTDNNKDNYYNYNYNTNNINFFLKFNDKLNIENGLKIILGKSFSNNLIQRNDENDFCQQLFDSKNILIGYIFELIFKNNNTLTKLDINYLTNRKTNYIKPKLVKEFSDILNPYIKSIMLCLYQIDTLKNYFLNIDDINKYNKVNKVLKEFFENFSQNPLQSISQVQINLFKTKNYENYINIIESIFSMIDSELSKKQCNEYSFSQVDLYDEQRGKTKFFDKRNNNDSIIQKLFYSVKETSIYCYSCKMTTYNFENISFFMIDTDKEEQEIIKLSENSLNKKIINQNIKCNFCANKNRECTIEKKLIDFLKIIIFILIGDKINKFILNENFLIILNNKNYSLFCFVENKENNVFFNKNNDLWYKYNEAFSEEKEVIDNLNPIVLFYKLSEIKKNNKKNENDINNINNMKNIKNLNNINDMNDRINIEERNNIEDRNNMNYMNNLKNIKKNNYMFFPENQINNFYNLNNKKYVNYINYMSNNINNNMSNNINYNMK